jgi:glycosyltransferase involved in cell wall biosynthesis
MTSRSLPNSVEGFGIAFLEAGYHGKPVIGYRSGGEAEAVVTGATGWLVTEADVPAVADIITKLIVDPVLRKKIGEQGRQHARQFSWDRTAGIIAAAID